MFKGNPLYRGYLDNFVTKLPAINWKIASGVLTVTVVWLFGDVLMPHVLHALHMLLEVVESLMDDFFTEVVGLSHHGAEMATAYSGFAVALYFLIKLLRKAYMMTMQAWVKLLAFCSELRQTRQALWIEQHWPFLATGAGVVTLAYLFMF